jgi:hypothetical protein
MESLRRDLTEILIAEAVDLLETRLAEERAAAAAAPTPASQQDLRDLEALLIREILPNLIGKRVAESLALQRTEIVDELRQSLPSAAPRNGARDQSSSPARGADSEATAAGGRLGEMATTALQSLRAALKRYER